MTRDERSRHLAHLRKIGICTRCQRASTERFALCLKCREKQAKAQRGRWKVAKVMGYDDRQSNPTPCTCGKRVSNPAQCEKWRAERDGATCPYQVFHQQGKRAKA